VGIFILNLADGGPDEAEARLLGGRWALGIDERHLDALADGDLALIHVGWPRPAFVGRAVLARPSAEDVGDAREIELADVEVWGDVVPLEDAIRRIDPTGSNPSVQANAQGFGSGLVRITEAEYEAVLALREEARRA
jgi:hypothetical protein